MFEEFAEHSRMVEEWKNDTEQVLRFKKVIDTVINCFSSGGKLIFCGNGGSAAEASHFAGEFVGKCSTKSVPLPALSISESVTQMSAITNDYGFDFSLTRGLKAFCNANDFVVLLSTSGTSRNILEAITWLEQERVNYSLWTSSRCPHEFKIKPLTLISPTNSTPRAQELHLLIGHTIAEIVEKNYLE